jgi:hypothetical protein
VAISSASAARSGPQNAAGNQLENEFLFADKDGVAGVVPALVARHHVELLGQQVDNFAFALVAPLGAQDDYVIHHSNFSRAQRTSPVRSLTTHNGLRQRAPSAPL